MKKQSIINESVGVPPEAIMVSGTRECIDAFILNQDSVNHRFKRGVFHLYGKKKAGRVASKS